MIAAEPVASPEPPCHQWPEPGRAVVEGHRGKGYVIKCRLSSLLAEHFQRDLVAEVGHQRHPRPIAAEREPDAVALTDPGQVAARHGDIAGPDIADTNAG